MFGLSNLQFCIALYVILGLVFSVGMLVKYHKDEPWYTWTGKFSLTQAYLIGLVSTTVIMFFGWWWLSITYIYHCVKAFILNWKYRNEHS